MALRLKGLKEAVLMGPPPPALGAALAAAATPEPTAPITESGAYLPMTSGGWILPPAKIIEFMHQTDL